MLGFDGGGTKVECLIATADGEVLGYGRGGPCNANFVSPEVARSSIDAAVEGTLAARAVRSQVRRAAPNARVRSRRFPAVVGATLVALEALGRPPDDALIARLKRQYARARRKYAEEKS